MSNLQHRAIQDEGPGSAMHDDGTPVSHPQQASVDHCISCPYEDKIVTNGTTARMVLMFLRDLVEQPTMYAQFPQTYGCPMMKCYQTFAEPLQLVQHLLSCSELPNGEFDCDKCNNWHEFPTNEKDWAQWTGWKSPQRTAQGVSGSGAGAGVTRRRSLGSKMRDAFALRRKESRNPMPMPTSQPHLDHSFSPLEMRPGTAATEAPRDVAVSSECPGPVRPNQIAFPGHESISAAFSDQHPKAALISGCTPEVDDRVMYWQGLNAEMCELQSAISSIAPSSTFETSSLSQAASTNTSRTTLFAPSVVGQYHQSPSPSTQGSSTTTMTPQQYMFSPQSTFDCNGPGTIEGNPEPSSAMSLDEPLTTLNEPALSHQSPAELRPPTAGETLHQWWGPRPTATDTPSARLATVSPPGTTHDCFPMHSPMGGGVLSRGVVAVGDGLSSQLSSPGGGSSIGSSRPRQPGSPLVESPFNFHVHYQVPSSHHPMSRHLSQDASLVDACISSGLYELAAAPGAGHGNSQIGIAMSSPHGHATTPGDHHHHAHVHRGTLAMHSKSTMAFLERLQSPMSDDELVCDECQWKPRGVRENLKGYLRKHKNTHKGLRLACDVDGCTKTFSRLDNLKKHKKDKHGIDDTTTPTTGSSVLPSKRVADSDLCGVRNIEDMENAPPKRPDTSSSNSEVRGVSGDYSMLWPALHL
ncbi:zinc finger C2H2-like protein [Diplogelasinospora grovesii]|uniref:Zinc finger C2H2-like protein n=1 Tax=Diplogelasinospora grovesii TaxID=303347 RepID=A0AAN6N188_9PEZI|nr:zinc finger C2H2-like protein [Diplogelasinospora grovesii]